ncbi:MAG: histidine kinase, partial [Chitinophagaceae bacterium]
MLLQTILAVILFFNLRKQTKNNSSLQKWDRVILAAIACSIALFIISSSSKQTFAAAAILSYLLTGAAIYAVITQKIFVAQKPMLYAFLPLFILNFIEDALLIIHRPTYKEWDTYLEIAEMFGLIWMIAMLIINGKQRKALEKERQKAEAKEQEFKITEQLKAQLEIQVQERTAEITRQKEELQ